MNEKKEATNTSSVEEQHPPLVIDDNEGFADDSDVEAEETKKNCVSQVFHDMKSTKMSEPCAPKDASHYKEPAIIEDFVPPEIAHETSGVWSTRLETPEAEIDASNNTVEEGKTTSKGNSPTILPEILRPKSMLLKASVVASRLLPLQKRAMDAFQAATQYYDQHFRSPMGEDLATSVTQCVRDVLASDSLFCEMGAQIKRFPQKIATYGQLLLNAKSAQADFEDEQHSLEQDWEDIQRRLCRSELFLEQAVRVIAKFFDMSMEEFTFFTQHQAKLQESLQVPSDRFHTAKKYYDQHVNEIKTNYGEDTLTKMLDALNTAKNTMYQDSSLYQDLRNLTFEVNEAKAAYQDAYVRIRGDMSTLGDLSAIAERAETNTRTLKRLLNRSPFLRTFRNKLFSVEEILLTTKDKFAVFQQHHARLCVYTTKDKQLLREFHATVASVDASRKTNTIWFATRESPVVHRYDLDKDRITSPHALLTTPTDKLGTPIGVTAMAMGCDSADLDGFVGLSNGEIVGVHIKDSDDNVTPVLQKWIGFEYAKDFEKEVPQSMQLQSDGTLQVTYEDGVAEYGKDTTEHERRWVLLNSNSY